MARFQENDPFLLLAVLNRTTMFIVWFPGRREVEKREEGSRGRAEGDDYARTEEELRETGLQADWLTFWRETLPLD